MILIKKEKEDLVQTLSHAVAQIEAAGSEETDGNISGYAGEILDLTRQEVDGRSDFQSFG